jgi:SAM-dependent methyltransferase
VSDNLVRDVHDAVAGSDIPAEASVRPPGTTPRQLAVMERDVLHKLRLERGMSVVEVGCGIGLLGVPVAARAARYVGLDFAPHAVEVANERLRAARANGDAAALVIDVLNADPQELRELGSFDRVLMYAVLHYARCEREARRFLEVTASLMAPGGRALIGNLPLDDLGADWQGPATPPDGWPARILALSRWVLSPGVGAVPLSRRWKVRNVVESVLKKRAQPEGFTPARLPPNYTLPLTAAAIERWLAELRPEVGYRWELPAPGVPLAPGRADLILVRR